MRACVTGRWARVHGVERRREVSLGSRKFSNNSDDTMVLPTRMRTATMRAAVRKLRERGTFERMYVRTAAMGWNGGDGRGVEDGNSTPGGRREPTQQAQRQQQQQQQGRSGGASVQWLQGGGGNRAPQQPGAATAAGAGPAMRRGTPAAPPPPQDRQRTPSSYNRPPPQKQQQQQQTGRPTQQQQTPQQQHFSTPAPVVQRAKPTAEGEYAAQESTDRRA